MRYILEGSVQKSGNKLGVQHNRLILQRATQLWCGRWIGISKICLLSKIEITLNILKAMQGAIDTGRRLLVWDTILQPNIEAWSYAGQRILVWLSKLKKRLSFEARNLYEKALNFRSLAMVLCLGFACMDVYPRSVVGVD